MRRFIQHIKQSLSWKLSLGILLMAVPIFVLSIGFLFIHSREKVKKEATAHAAGVVNTMMQHITRHMDIVETATDVNDWEVTANLQPDSILAISRGIVMLNGHIDGCSISTEPNIFPKYGRYFSAYTVREADTVSTVIEEPYEYFEKIWYKTPRLNGKPCWVVYYDESDSLALTIDGMIASYSKPLYNDEKHFVGVISTDLSLIRLSKVITSETPYEGSYFMMTGEEGRYILHPDTAQLFVNTIYSDANPRENADIFALGHEMTTGKTGSMSVRINGEQCLVRSGEEHPQILQPHELYHRAPLRHRSPARNAVQQHHSRPCYPSAQQADGQPAAHCRRTLRPTDTTKSDQRRRGTSAKQFCHHAGGTQQSHERNPADERRDLAP